jgi:hypothetical protein
MGKHGPECHVCKHRERAAIDLALARGVSPGALARRYGVGSDSLYRHSRNHLAAQLRAKLIAGPDLDIDLERLRETGSQSLLMNLVALRRRLFHSFERVGLVNALRPFPEAARAVASVLHQIEGKAATDMAADRRQFAGGVP